VQGTRKPPTFTEVDFAQADKTWGPRNWVICWCSHNDTPKWVIHSKEYHIER
jgi:hypothetical protein